jgi:intracellular sulfur oxidation DsrE/DsrF family protein
MEEQELNSSNPRRNFITTVLSGAAAFGLSSIVSPLNAQASAIIPTSDVNDAEKWFQQVKGKHKMVFDIPKHADGKGIGWGLTLLDTYKDLGVPETDVSAVIIFRSGGTPLAIADNLWKKYDFGKRIELKDPLTKKFTMYNLFAKCKTEDDDCIEAFQKQGGLVCVCNHAVEGMAGALAKKLKLKKEDVQKEFKDNLLPGIQLVPSGIWALNHAQELGCTFSFAG